MCGKIDMFLKEQLDCDDPIIRDMVMEMRVKFDKYWSEYILLFDFATILDPQCKLVFIKYCYEKFYENKKMAIRKVSDIQFKFEMLLREYTQSTNPPTSVVSSTPSSHTGGSSSRIENRKCKFDYLAVCFL